MSDLPAAEPRASRKFPLWRIGGSVLSIGLLIYLVYQQGWNEFSAVLRQIPLQYFLFALGLALCSRVCVTLRWYVLLHSAKVKISFCQTLKLVFMGLFSSNFLPSTVGGDLVRMAGAVYIRLEAGVIAASLLVDRLVGMAGMALLLPVGLMMVAGTGGVSASGSLLAMPKIRGLWERLLKFLSSLLQSSIYWIKHPASLGWAFLFTLGHMLFTYLIVAVLLNGMDQPMPLWQIGALWSLSYFVSLAPVSINGLGLQEVSIAYLYSQFGGVPMETGLVLAVMMRLVFLVASLPGAYFLATMGGLREPQNQPADRPG